MDSAGLAVFALATICVLLFDGDGLAAEQDEATLRPRQTDPTTPPVDAVDAGKASAAADDGDYHFEGAISRKVLENYLDRSVTMAYFLVTGKSEGNREYPYHDDDVRLIQNIGAKFIGRAIYRWNGESRLIDQDFWEEARTLLHRIHAHDPDVIFQGCLFETISTDVNRVPISAWVFVDFGLPAEDRNFSYDAMLNEDGKLVRHWGRSSVPDVTRLETQLWFYYLAGAYINLGCEALHLGQVRLMGMADPDLREWSRLIARIRATMQKPMPAAISCCWMRMCRPAE